MSNIKKAFLAENNNTVAANQTNQNEKVETTMTNQTTQTTTTNNETVNAPVSAQQAQETRKAPSRSLGKFADRGSNYDKDWFKNRQGDLSAVVDDFLFEEVNSSLMVTFEKEGFVPSHGLLKMYINAPSQAQFEKMSTVAVVNLVTTLGTVKNISVRENQYGGLSVEPQQRSYQANGKTEYISDINLASVVKAQILTVVDPLLKPVDGEEA